MTSKLKMRYLRLKYVSMKVDLDKHLIIVVILVKYGKILRFKGDQGDPIYKGIEVKFLCLGF